MFRRFFRKAGQFFDVLDGIEDFCWFLLAAALLICLPVLFIWRAAISHSWWIACAILFAASTFIYALRREWKLKGFGKLAAAFLLLWVVTAYALRFFLE
jgi:hypothetical protein